MVRTGLLLQLKRSYLSKKLRFTVPIFCIHSPLSLQNHYVWFFDKYINPIWFNHRPFWPILEVEYVDSARCSRCHIIQRAAYHADFRNLSGFGLPFVMYDGTFPVKYDTSNIDGKHR